ncbi:DUF418 domain-containing protein YeiB [Enterobacillus tribolii]|uniref:DUF418 domain-containing protein n=1 Tax=Enterobacillus tribolii TaxID=1487935 RepID=A0A370QRQ5_9GAMM|nr:DUF418 domain-containing protein YeiB [Enterobacillus tribolii]MBW7983585.1 DUF418 family protein [Enterobacillus tribolii]RDK91916.1 uncharacterized protein C8D90_10460 [Enterobacillus tribolii]
MTLQRLHPESPAPVLKAGQPRPRIDTLDCARGLAVLGILLLNLVGFGLPKAAYLNPAYAGQPAFADALTWLLLNIFVQGKFLAMFALLFGAGLQLLMPRGKSWIRARLTWLVLFGLIHGIFFWEGDILLAYGMIGLICWRLIRDAASAAALLRTGLLLYAIGTGLLLLLALSAGPEPTAFWQPGPAAIQYEHLWKVRGGWEAWRNRTDLVGGNLMAMAVQYGWQLAGLMLLGAALMRSGWLSGAFSLRHYRKVALWLIVAGLLIQTPTALAQWRLEWDYRWAGYLLQVPGELAALPLMLGYVALLYGFWPRLSRITGFLRAVGRMALSNYLLQTLICTTLFYHFDLFAQWNRSGLLLLVLPVWAANILFSMLWLRYFRQGPLEWLWRRLTTLAATPQKEVR